MNEKIEFSKRFVAALKFAQINDFSNAKLGKAFGVSSPMITHYRHGEKMASVDTMIRIANECGVSVLWLAQGYGEMRLGETSGKSNFQPDLVVNGMIIEFKGFNQKDRAYGFAKKLKQAYEFGALTENVLGSFTVLLDNAIDAAKVHSTGSRFDDPKEFEKMMVEQKEREDAKRHARSQGNTRAQTG